MVNAFSSAVADDDDVSSTVTTLVEAFVVVVAVAVVDAVAAVAVEFVLLLLLLAVSKALLPFLSCSVTEPSEPTEALHINTRDAPRFVRGRCMLLGTCGRCKDIERGSCSIMNTQAVACLCLFFCLCLWVSVLCTL